jgi:stage II sporulation SpoAA-like protein
MLQRIPDVPDGIDALAAIGTLTRQDYEQSIEPILDEARRSSRRIRLLVQLGPEYDGYTAGAAWEKTANAFRSPSLLRLLDGYAVVTDLHWLHEWTHVMGFLLPFPLRVFGNDERDEAIAWLSTLPEGPGVSHYLVSESGVLVVEVTAPLRAQDFDALAATADAWLETHDALPGVVIHARQFPGWENAASMLRHFRFVRDHHRAVRRVALAADGKRADLIAGLAEHFVHAEIKRFGYDGLDEAVAWAAGPVTEAAAVAAVGTSEPVTS